MSDSNTYAAKKVLGTMWTYLLLGGAFAWLGSKWYYTGVFPLDNLAAAIYFMAAAQILTNIILCILWFSEYRYYWQTNYDECKDKELEHWRKWYNETDPNLKQDYLEECRVRMSLNTKSINRWFGERIF